MHPDREVNITAAEGLDDCRKMMRDAIKGKYPGYLIEGMACPGGCVAGPGTLQSIKKSQAQVKAYMKRSPRKNATENAYRMQIPELLAMGRDEPDDAPRIPQNTERVPAPEELVETRSIETVDEPHDQ